MAKDEEEGKKWEEEGGKCTWESVEPETRIIKGSSVEEV